MTAPFRSTTIRPPRADYAQISGAISGSGGLTKTGDGVLILSATPTYSGNTVISGGALQATLPSSFLSLDGGVFQCSGATTFTRNLAASGSSDFQWTPNGGGFAAGGGALTVRVNNGNSTLAWDSQIQGTLKFGSTTAANMVDFQNGIDLGSSTRTIAVDDNPSSANDYAQISGAVSGAGGITKTGAGKLAMTNAVSYSGPTSVAGGTLDYSAATSLPSGSYTVKGGSLLLGSKSQSIASLQIVAGTVTGAGVLTSKATFDLQSGAANVGLAGSVGLTKIGADTLTLGGSVGNTYTGDTTVTGGVVDLDKTSGYAIPGNMFLMARESSPMIYFKRANQIPASCVVTFGGGNYPHLIVYGNTVTVAGISDTFGGACIENTQSEGGVANGALVVNNSANFTYTGFMRNSYNGSGTFSLQKNGPGTLAIFGDKISYTGNTTITGGALQADDGIGLPSASYLLLDGGVLQSNGTATVSFTRTLSGTTSSNRFQWTGNGGGFAAGGVPMTININGGTSQVAWVKGEQRRRRGDRQWRRNDDILGRQDRDNPGGDCRCLQFDGTRQIRPAVHGQDVRPPGCQIGVDDQPAGRSLFIGRIDPGLSKRISQPEIERTGVLEETHVEQARDDSAALVVDEAAGIEIDVAGNGAGVGDEAAGLGTEGADRRAAIGRDGIPSHRPFDADLVVDATEQHDGGGVVDGTDRIDAALNQRRLVHRNPDLIRGLAVTLGKDAIGPATRCHHRRVVEHHGHRAAIALPAGGSADLNVRLLLTAGDEVVIHQAAATADALGENGRGEIAGRLDAGVD